MFWQITRKSNSLFKPSTVIQMSSLSSVAERLSQEFHGKLQSLTHCEIINESYMHSVPKGSETHFKVILVSPQFAGLLPVKRHRLVYQIADGEIRPSTMSPQDDNYYKKIHALSIIAKTPEEWESVKDTISRKSPSCQGGGKL